MNNVVCYTCITDRYDSLKQPLVVSKDIDYVYFTDNLSLQSNIWQIRPIPDELRNLSNVKKQRVIKICPHRYLREYDISIWIDGSMQVQGDLQKFIQQYDLYKCPLYTRIHPSRHCIYDEAEACMRMNKGSCQEIVEQISKYKKEGYPENAGMVETGILLRKHNDMKCQMFDNMWASELLLHSHRDQLSFNYVCWKMHFIPGCLNSEFSIYGDRANTFKLYRHGR